MRNVLEKSEISLRSGSSMRIVSTSTEVILSNLLGSKFVFASDLRRANRRPTIFKRFGLADSDIGTGIAQWAINCKRDTIIL